MENEEITKIKRQAKEIRKMIISLGNLIEISELPIKLKVEIIEGSKNLKYVWKEIGLVTLK